MTVDQGNPYEQSGNPVKHKRKPIVPSAIIFKKDELTMTLEYYQLVPLFVIRKSGEVIESYASVIDALAHLNNDTNSKPSLFNLRKKKGDK